jgi:hypothetical protein
MNSPFAPTTRTIVRFRRPPHKRPGAVKSGFALRLEGSLAAVAVLAPVIPIFPDLALAPHASSENSKLKV